MSLEIHFKQDSNLSPQHLSLQDGESLQVFSGEIFQIQNPQVVAQLVPQANDLQVVCQDGSSYILKSFLDTLFSQEPVLEIKEGTSITWHDFVQQTDGVDLTDLPDDQSSQSLRFAPLHVITMTSESQKWALSQFPPESGDRAKDSGIVSNEPSFVPPATEEESQEDSRTKTALISKDPQLDTGIEGGTPEAKDSRNAESSRTGSDNGSSIHYTTSNSLNGIDIDIRDFIPQLREQNLSDDLTITAKAVGRDPIEIEIDPGSGILRLADDIFEDDNQKKFIISIKDNGNETDTDITITQTKDGGGEVFHLILSRNRVTENNEGALIGKLDTNDSGQGHTYEYSIVSDNSGVFEIVGNVLKLKDGVSIDYEAQPDRYPLAIESIDENGNRIKQTMSVWPEDVNEAASVSSVGVSSLEGVAVAFNPEDFENSFEDEDSDYLEMIRIDSLPDNGVLLIEGKKVTNGQLIDIDQVENLEFHPDVNRNGEAEFTWSGFDGQKWSGESSPVKIAIEAVNDAPVVSVNVGSETASTETPFEIVLPENASSDPDENNTGSKRDDIITTGSGDDYIDMGKGDDTIDAGSGDDTINSIDGYDTVESGGGDYTITIDYGVGGSGSEKGSGFGGGEFGLFDGGDGEDTLVFEGSGLEIDLTFLNNGAITNIEGLDISGDGDNNLRLSAEDVLDMTDGDNKLFIDGNSGDSVEMSDNFVSQITENVDGVYYTHFYDAGADAHIYVKNEINDLGTF